MARRPPPEETLKLEGPVAFAFLVDEFGFDGPEFVDDGLIYYRADLSVQISNWIWNRETGFSTTILGRPDAEGRRRSAGLDCLYVACGLGPPQDVPETTSSTHHVTSKRIAQHSAALRALLPHLDDDARLADLIRRCRG
jgi:hypothetical protein